MMLSFFPLAEHSGPAFEEFLSCIGQKVRLKGFEKYRAQLDNKSKNCKNIFCFITFVFRLPDVILSSFCDIFISFMQLILLDLMMEILNCHVIRGYYCNEIIQHISCYLAADSTGQQSVYTSFNNCEIMFHVSTMLPYTPNNTQQVIPI